MLKPNQETQCISVRASRTSSSWGERESWREQVLRAGAWILANPVVKGRNPGAVLSKASQHRSESSHLGAT